MTRGPARGPVVLPLILAAVALSVGCKKKEVLIEVSLTTPTAVAGLDSVKITAGGVAKTFTLTQLSPTPVIYGIYVSEDVGTEVRISDDLVVTQVEVSAGVQTGASCVGLAGSGSATIRADGIGTVSIALTAGNACSEPQPPSLLHCKEYDHISPARFCDPADATTHVFARSVAFSPDGRYFVSSANDGRVKIWTFDGRALHPEGTVLTTDGIPEIAFSPDGKLLAVAAIAQYPQPLDLYEVGRWTKRRSLTVGAGFVPGIGFSPDSKYVIALESDGYGAGDLVALPVSGATPGTPKPLAIDPWWLAVGQTQGANGTAIAVASFDDRVALLSFAGGRFTDPTIFSATNDPYLTAWAIAISPDGSFLAAGGDDGAFHYWNVPFQSATPASAPFTIGESLTTLAFSPANDYVAVASGAGVGTVTIWDLLAHTQRGAFQTTYAPYGIAYAPSGLAVAGGEDTCGLVFLCAD